MDLQGQFPQVQCFSKAEDPTRIVQINMQLTDDLWQDAKEVILPDSLIEMRKQRMRFLYLTTGDSDNFILWPIREQRTDN